MLLRIEAFDCVFGVDCCSRIKIYSNNRLINCFIGWRSVLYALTIKQCVCAQVYFLTENAPKTNSQHMNSSRQFKMETVDLNMSAAALYGICSGLIDKISDHFYRYGTKTDDNA